MTKKRKNNGMGFAVFTLLYAVAFLTLAGFGLKWFWGCMEAYEASRPHNAIDSYMAKVDRDYIIAHSGDFMAEVDPNFQDEETCREIVQDALKGEISYARKVSSCTEDKQVFAIRCGKQVVGTFTIVTDQEDKYGFKPWTFQEESYDLSYLMGSETITITAPEGYSVYVGGVQLDESYIVEQSTSDYAVYGDLYEEYDLPRFVLNTYEVGPFLGEPCESEVFDPEGNPFIYDETFDPYTLLPELNSRTEKKLEAFVEEFLEAYVIFAGCANDSRATNYYKVIQYVVPDSNLAKRMFDALDGLQYAQSRGDKIAGITIHHMLPLADGEYLCDVTYLVDTIGNDGVVQTTTKCRLVIVRSDDKLLVKSKVIY